MRAITRVGICNLNLNERKTMRAITRVARIRIAPARADLLGVRLGAGRDAEAGGGGGPGEADVRNVERGVEPVAQVLELGLIRVHLVAHLAEHELRLVRRELRLARHECRRARRDRAQRLVPAVRPHLAAASAREALLRAREPHVAEEEKHRERRLTDWRQAAHRVFDRLDEKTEIEAPAAFLQ